MTADKYWRVSTDPLLTASSLVEFVVLDCEPSDYGSRGVSGGGKGPSDGGAGKESPALWDVVVSPGLQSISYTVRATLSHYRSHNILTRFSRRPSNPRGQHISR